MKRSHWLALFAGILLGSGITWGFLRLVERLFWGDPVRVQLLADRTLTWPSSSGSGTTSPDGSTGVLVAGTRGLLWSKGSIKKLRVEATWVEPGGFPRDLQLLPEGTSVTADYSKAASSEIHRE